MDLDVIACLIIEEVLQQEEEEEELKKRTRIKRKWSRGITISTETYSSSKLLKTIESGSNNYKNLMGMTDETFHDILSIVANHIQKQDTIMRNAIPASNRLAITLRFLATGCSYEVLKTSTGVSPQSIGNIVIETCEAIVRVMKPFIKLPKSPTEWMNIAANFYKKTKFPNCVGAIDGKHIHIMRPYNTGSLYFNYKRSCSIVCMAIVNGNSEFMMVDIGAKGSTLESGLFANTNFFEKLENDELNLPKPKPVLTGQEPLPFVFVANSDLTLRKNILNPFGHSNLTNDKIIYNKTLCAAQVKAENAFEILASRFRVLQTVINLSPEKTTTVVLACCYLHNYLRRQSITKVEKPETMVELTGMEQKDNKNASKEALEVRLKFSEAIKQLRTV